MFCTPTHPPAPTRDIFSSSASSKNARRNRSAKKMTESQSVKELTGAAEASGKSFVEKYPNGPKSCDRRSDKRFLAKKVVNFGVAKAVKDAIVLPKKK